MIGKHKRRIRAAKEDAQLDITSFMNLMIVLVPVLLMMMVFSRITVVQLQLPGLSDTHSADSIAQEQLELLVSNSGLSVYFPQGYLVTEIEPVIGEQDSLQHDYASLQAVLKQIKQTLLAKGVEKQDITLLMEDDVPYQTIISVMDATRSYKDVVAASVVDAELFPNVALADAPAASVLASASREGQ
ncbi:biopolymer transporter ExbD [Aestuariibacter salexigens]|uniref:biopolymer transporter ExbD n=1 Tax=Aestuariibacter salexigens TaxID=226010 RepID=UPI0004188D07|nr:biopolymer transporter ExbD [Aestuariibacter salexigens]